MDERRRADERQRTQAEMRDRIDNELKSRFLAGMVGLAYVDARKSENRNEEQKAYLEQVHTRSLAIILDDPERAGRAPLNPEYARTSTAQLLAALRDLSDDDARKFELNSALEFLHSLGQMRDERDMLSVDSKLTAGAAVYSFIWPNDARYARFLHPADAPRTKASPAGETRGDRSAGR